MEWFGAAGMLGTAGAALAFLIRRLERREDAVRSHAEAVSGQRLKSSPELLSAAKTLLATPTNREGRGDARDARERWNDVSSQAMLFFSARVEAAAGRIAALDDAWNLGREWDQAAADSALDALCSALRNDLRTEDALVSQERLFSKGWKRFIF